MMSVFVGVGMSASTPTGRVAQLQPHCGSSENDQNDHAGVLFWYFTHGLICSHTALLYMDPNDKKHVFSLT